MMKVNSRVVPLVIFITSLLMVSPLYSSQQQLNWMGHWKGQGKRQLLVEEVKKEFEFLNPGIEVNLVYDTDIEGSGKYYKWRVAHEIANMIKSGEIKWDVVFLGVTVYNYVAELLDDPLWGKKHLVDFSEVDGFFQSQKEFILKTPYYKEQTGGIYVGPFIEGFLACLWYNTKVAEKIGITVPEQGMTTNDFLSYAAKLAEYNKTNSTEIPFLNLSNFNRIEGLFEHIFKSHIKDPQQAVELSYSKEKAEAFLETLLFFERLSQYQPILNPDWRTKDFVQYQKDFLKGGGLFIHAGTWMYGHFQGNAPDILQFGRPVESPMAKYSNGLVGQFSNVWGVMKNSPQRKAGIELLQLWSESKNAEKWMVYTKNPTGLKGHLTDHSSMKEKQDVYRQFVNTMLEGHKDQPLRNYRAPVYVFGRDCKITGEAFRIALAEILEGKIDGREYFTETMIMHGRSL